jgi:hypothetical protein
MFAGSGLEVRYSTFRLTEIAAMQNSGSESPSPYDS